jgi:undecaprenyl-diphosphooligosaccharide--protein glycosyltransferase
VETSPELKDLFFASESFKMKKAMTFSLTNNRKVLLVFLSILLVYGISFYKRQADYQSWMQDSKDYVVDHVTAMMDMDPYYWLKMAQELDEGHLGKGKADSLRGYPDRVPFVLKGRQPSLLAHLISLNKNFTGGDYYRAGLLLIPILAGLFVFPLYFYFKRLGFGASAVLGGLIGSFSTAYYMRTMMGRVDTDLLNIFFPLAVGCFILPISKEKSLRANLSLAGGAGLTMYLFTWWYQQPSFILVYLFFLTVYLLAGRVQWKQILLILPVFLLACGPHYVLQTLQSLRTFLFAYVSPPPTGRIVWPDIMPTIIEAEKRGIWATLHRLDGFLPLDFAGIAGLLYLYLRRFREMIPVTPLILLGAWSLVGPVRFSMYLAPLIGIGVGVLIELLMKYVGGKAGFRPLLVSLSSITLMFILFFSTVGYTAFYSSSPPIISAPETRAILDIKKIVPKHSAMFTPFWEFGYPLMEIGDFATYHDGGLQGGMRSTLTAKAMISTSQKKMVSMLSYLQDYGFNHLASVVSKDRLSAKQMMNLVFNYPGGFRGDNVYVIFLQDMLWKVSSMSHFGTWDFNRKKGDSMDYVQLNCFSSSNNVMRCMDGTIDLNRGYMNDGTEDIPLRAALLVNDGYVVNRQDYDHGDDTGYYLQVLMKNNKIRMILVAGDRLFHTNFNQQFLLGNYDKRYFEEVYNNVPMGRVLKVKKVETDGSTRSSGNSEPK